MLKNISNLGSILNKSVQKSISGGNQGEPGCDGCYDDFGFCIPFEHMFVIPESC
ncbi:hypothetical protein [uncultured Tenacibaculum sp.]|uniref:hypothetical protein n=1 Tax=uncultured Tenacibaculum sp. TaxID=174713 RepID=UPI00262CD18A|nr:hypothetical protein [uncultured Tenacibaculum sp.]